MMSEIYYYGLLLHLIGDYITQSHWMANEKTKRMWPALCHSVIYSMPFLLLVNIQGVVIIGLTHYLIDRYRLARYVCFIKNSLCPRGYNGEWVDNNKTGYPSETPDWLAVWLLIITDNTIHILINTAVLWGMG